MFSALDIKKGFRYMQTGKHMGKIIINMAAKGDPLLASRTPSEVSFSAKSTYILMGGLGGLGKALSIWMVERGARSLVFFSRSAGGSNEDIQFLKELGSQGCHTVAIAGSITNMVDVMRALEAAPAPIAGIFQMTAALKVSEMMHKKIHLR